MTSKRKVAIDMKAVIVNIGVAALLYSSAALARRDEAVRWSAQTVQSAQTSKSQEALAKLRAQEAALLKHLAELRQEMAKALDKVREEGCRDSRRRKTPATRERLRAIGCSPCTPARFRRTTNHETT